MYRLFLGLFLTILAITTLTSPLLAQESEPDLVTLNFPEPTNIRDVVKSVSMWSGKNVILDRNVNGKVQIISPQPVTREEAYQAFLSALNMLDLTTVETGKVVKIMRTRNAVKANLKTYVGANWVPATDEMITQIIPLKYIDADEVRRTLSRIVSSRSVVDHEQTNTLIVSETGHKIRRIVDILSLMDVKINQPQVTIVPLRYADANKISDTLDDLINASMGRSRSKRRRSSRQKTFKFIADERTNSVIALGPPRRVAEIREMVRRLDQPTPEDQQERGVYVHALQYADAEKLATTISALTTTQKVRRRRPVTRRRGRRKRQPTQQTISSSQLTDVKITAEPTTNSLLIKGGLNAYRAVKQLANRLDRRKAQVLLEVDILDVDVSKAFGMRVSSFLASSSGDSSVVSSWQGAGLAPVIAGQAQPATTATTQVEQAAAAFAEDLTVGILSGQRVAIPGIGEIFPTTLLRLIKTDAATRVLSSPRLLTLENEEAEITVGEKIFFRSSLTSPQSNVTTNKIEKEDVGLTLKVKPGVNQQGYVTLDVEVESTTATIDGNTNLPRIGKRKSKQNITAKNEQTIVISGLLQSQEFEAFQKIPLLGEIPIVGWLFRNSSLQKKRTNLMIFIRPHIIYGPADLARIAEENRVPRQQLLNSAGVTAGDRPEHLW